MRKILFALAACMSAALPGATLADTVFVGGGPGYEEIQTTFHGQPVTLVQMVASYHEMDLPPHHVQVIGLEEFFFVLKEKPDYQAKTCEKWITQVQGDEAAWTQNDTMYPYLELDIAAKAKVMNIDGYNVYRAKDVLCWEAMDFGPPLY
jgi:hypothetical protein